MTTYIRKEKQVSTDIKSCSMTELPVQTKLLFLLPLLVSVCSYDIGKSSFCFWLGRKASKCIRCLIWQKFWFVGSNSYPKHRKIQELILEMFYWNSPLDCFFAMISFHVLKVHVENSTVRRIIDIHFLFTFSRQRHSFFFGRQWVWHTMKVQVVSEVFTCVLLHCYAFTK